MALEQFVDIMRPAIEKELQGTLDLHLSKSLPELYGMLAYHMGWEGEGAGPEAQGKRIRPLLVLLCAESAGGDWRCALPAAAAVELIHNFSLIHDDIQDRSELRRGRPTVWAKWGVAQAINAGDLMFSLAHLSVLRLRESCAENFVIEAVQLLQKACVRLTEGQYMDMSYETRREITLDEYWPMVAGKTASLLATSARLGALVAGCEVNRQEAFWDYGYSLGLAFQAWDDYLGVWGDPSVTGKSIESDLLTGKKSLPVVYGLSQRGKFARRWLEGQIRVDEVAQLAQWLKEEGAQEFTRATAEGLTNQALKSLNRAVSKGAAGDALYELTKMLLQRDN